MIEGARKPSKTLRTLYNAYNKRNKDTQYSLEENEFKDGCSLIFEDIIEQLLGGNTAKLPYAMGELYIDKMKLRGKKVDYGATKKYGKTIYYTNLHSDGYTYKVKWHKSYTSFPNRKLYRFKLTRKHSRRLASLLKKNEIKIFKRYV